MKPVDQGVWRFEMFLTGIDWSEKYLDICVTKDSDVILR